MIKRILTGILLFFSCLFLIGAAKQDQLTLMIYMTGSDLESLGGAASSDLEEMRTSVPVNEQLTVLVMTGGTAEWKTEKIGSQNTIWKLTPEGLQFLADGPQQSMGDPDTLSRFLKTGTELFPARQYALILWDHGAGPMGGICFDEKDRREGETDSLSLKELSAALKNSPFSRKPLAFIGFDACLMATIEVAGAVAPYAEYMIASQEPEPVSGWNYRFLKDLPGKTGAAAGRDILDAYSDSLSDRSLPASLSCIDLSKIGALQGELERLFNGLGQDLSPEGYQRFARCRQMAKTLGASSVAEWDLVDLKDLAEELEAERIADAAGLKSALSSAVCCCFANEPYVHGLSIYFPFENKLNYSRPWGMRYRTLDMPASYQSFLYRFTRYWLQESTVPWRDGASLRTGESAQAVSVSMSLTEEEASDFGTARFVVLEKAAENEYRLIYMDDHPRRNGNELSSIYAGTALYLLDENERILAGPLSWNAVGEEIATFALLEQSVFASEPIYLIWKKNQNAGYRLAEIEIQQEAAGQFMKSSLTLHKGDVLKIGGYARRLPEKGEETAFEEWPWGNMIAYSPVELQKDDEISRWHLAFLPLYATDERVAYFEVTDLHRNMHLSEIIPLENPDKHSLTDEKQVIENSDYQVTLENVFLMTGADPGVMIDYRVASKRGPLHSDLLSLSLNDTAILLWASPIEEQSISEQEKSCRMILYAKELQKTREEQVDTLTLTGAFEREDGKKEILRFPFELSLDLGMLAESPENGRLLAEAEADGLHFSLMSLENDARGNLTGEMHIENRTGENIPFDSFAASVNGEREVTASIAVACGYPKMLPAGESAWCLCRIDTESDADRREEDSDQEGTDPLVRRIDFRVQIGDRRQILSFSLGE